MTSLSALTQLLGGDRASGLSAGSQEFPSRDSIEFGDFRIDLQNRTVTLRGEKLDLTSQEFDVLLFLISHPRRVITPQTMLATSWRPNPPQQTEFLRALLSLRKKLDALGGGTHYLRTESWVVYSFDPTPSRIF